MTSANNSRLIANALLKSNPELAATMDAANSFRAWVQERGARVALYRDYERGDHRAVITDQMRKMLRLTEDDSGLTDFNGNYCALVIDKMAGRLHVSEVAIGKPKEDGKEDTAQVWLTDLLERNDFDNLQSTTFRGAIRDADSYVMIDPETLKWTAEPAYDGYSGVVAIFDPGTRTPIWACKIWSEAQETEHRQETLPSSSYSMKLVVYEPNKVSYWSGQENGGEVKPDNETALAERTKTKRMTDADGLPIEDNFVPFPVSKVPILHYANRYENYSETGESEIRAAITLQDIYNRTLHTATYGSENAGWTKPWSKGMEVSVDGMVPGAIINLTLKDPISGDIIIEPTDAMLEFLKACEVGQFEATDIHQFIDLLDKLERVISQVTQTPIYGITTSENLSGEALKQLEIGLIGKCIRFQIQNIDAVRELVQLTAEIQNAFNTGLGSAPVFDKVTVTWKSPEILDTSAQVTVLITMRRDAPGLFSDDFYRRKIGGLLGMSQAEINKEAEAVKKQKAEALRNRVNSVRVPVDGTTGNSLQPDETARVMNNVAER